MLLFLFNNPLQATTTFHCKCCFVALFLELKSDQINILQCPICDL